MAVIQRYDKRILPPEHAGQKMVPASLGQVAVKIPGDLVSGPYQAVERATGYAAQAMEGLKELGRGLGDLGERIIKIDQDTTYNKGVTGSLTAFNQRIAEMGARPPGGHKEWNDELRKLALELREQHSQDLVGPWRRNFDAQFDRMHSQAAIKVAGMIRQRTIEEAKAQLDVDITAGLQALGMTSNPIERRNIITRLASRIDQDSQNGLILPTKAVAKKLAIREAWAELEISERIMRDPRAVQAALAEGPKTKQGDTKYWQIHYYLNMLPAHKRIEFRKAADIRVRQLKAESDKLTLTKADIWLRQEYGADFDAMRKALRDPKVYQLQLGLSVQQATTLRSIYKGQADIDRVETERNQKKQAYAGIKMITDQQGKGDIAGAFATLAAIREVIPADTYRQLKGDLTKARLQTTEADWAQLQLKLRDNEPPTFLEAIGQGLKPDKYEAYIKAYQARIKELKKTGPRTDQVKLAIAQYDRLMGSGANADEDLVKMRPAMVNSINWFRQKHNLEPDDPKIMEFAQRLLEPVIKQRGRLWDTTSDRLLEIYAEHKPWITGAMPRFAEPLYDIDLIHANQEELLAVRDMLKEARVEPTRYSKQRALAAIRQDVDYSKVVMPGPLQGIPAAAIQKIRVRLQAQGRATEPLYIREVWDRYGQAVMRWK